MRKIFGTILPFLLVGLFIALSVGSALNESLTFDEIVHAQEGINTLTKHTFLIDIENPPLVRELAMAPTVLGFAKLLPPRFVIIFLSALTLIAVYGVTKWYFGDTQARFALFLLALEPTFLGNSHYVTLDTGATLFFFVGYIAFVRLMERYSVKRLVVAGMAWGVAFASKITAIPFLIVSVLILRLPQRLSLRKTVFRIVIFSLCAGLVIWATYFFACDVVIAPRENSGRLSSRLYAYATAHHNEILKNILTFGETQKIPLGNYLAVIKNAVVWTGAKSHIFFLGNFYPTARWYFMGGTFLLKLPIPLLAFFILGLIARRGKRIAIFAIPVFVILGVSSLVNIQPWIRYVLPAMPFVAIVASGSIRWFKEPIPKIIFVVLCFWFAWGAGSAFPHYLSYANEVVGPSEARYRVFMDSNLDWGQSLPDLEQYIKIVQPGYVSFSYFGRDNGDHYGLISDMPYGSHRYEDICAFHHINLPYESTKIVLAISVSNWYYCGYYQNPQFMNRSVKAVVGGSILIL